MNKLLVFKATWCGPCKQYAPMIDSVKSDIENLGVEIQFVDVDENPELASAHNVRGIPTTVFKDIRWSGAKSGQEVLQIIKDNLRL